MVAISTPTVRVPQMKNLPNFNLYSATSPGILDCPCVLVYLWQINIICNLSCGAENAAQSYRVTTSEREKRDGTAGWRSGARSRSVSLCLAQWVVVSLCLAPSRSVGRGLASSRSVSRCLVPVSDGKRGEGGSSVRAMAMLSRAMRCDRDR